MGRAAVLDYVPSRRGLAGTQLEWFGGFFEQRWREYNFRKGRVLARPTLESMLGAYPEQDGGHRTRSPRT
ncbi:hypothetical protein VT84_06725 [Gemmata sp. SH-PL17]|nr:hypothetical protein VT84_06725 [Gemmata sp. SH-PL17]